MKEIDFNGFQIGVYKLPFLTMRWTNMWSHSLMGVLEDWMNAILLLNETSS